MQISSTFRDQRLRRRGRWILLATLIGIVSGLGAILFDLLFHFAQWAFLERIGRFSPPGAPLENIEAFGPDNPWLLPVSLAAGGLVSGLLVYFLAPEAEGHGTDSVIKSFHHQLGKVRKRVAPIKAISSAITIGAGGSAGREGPIAQIGASFGSFLGGLLKLTHHDRRILMMAGMAGGIGSIFRAPLGAAFFSAEVLYSKPEFEYEVLLPGLISAITGYSIYSSYAGWGFLFDVPEISFHEPKHLALYAVLGVACALVGVIYPKFFYFVRDQIFKPMRLPGWIKPAIGMTALGLIAVVFPQALGMGYGYVQQAIDGSLTIQFLLLFAAIKIVATSLTISSGGSGGVFGPSLVIGGALGAACGLGFTEWIPGWAPEPAACVMVGMGGFFAGVAKTPFAAVIMVMEMTGSYGLLVPSLLVAAIAYLCLPLAVRLYENQVPARPDSPAHTGSFATDILRNLTVRDCLDHSESHGRTISADTPFDQLINLAASGKQTVFPVVSEADKLLGELSLEDIRRVLLEPDDERPKIAGDFMHSVVGPLTPEDNLTLAARLLASRQSDTVIVVNNIQDQHVVALLSRRELILTYGREMARLKETDHRGEVADHEPF
jgi:CIC family chloride channel protein